MELKFEKVLGKVSATVSSNRTFMELKYASTEFQKICRYGSNRTFMELKLNQHQKN